MKGMGHDPTFYIYAHSAVLVPEEQMTLINKLRLQRSSGLYSSDRLAPLSSIYPWIFMTQAHLWQRSQDTKKQLHGISHPGCGS